MLIGVDASRATVAQRTGTEAYSLHAIRALIDIASMHRLRLYFNVPPSSDLFPRVAHCEHRVLPAPRLWTHGRLSVEMSGHPPDVLWVPSHVLPAVHPRHSVVTVHDLGHRYYPQAHTLFQRWYLEWSARYHVRAAAHLLADSYATRHDLVRWYGADPARITVAYLGVDPTFKPVRDPAEIARVAQRYGLGQPYLLCVGTVQPRKNLIRLIEAMAVLREQGAMGALTLALVGKRGWLSDPIFSRVGELGLEARVMLTGYVDDADLPALYSGAELFVMPSLYEGFCMPVLEAMACGTPVAASNASSLPELVRDAAICFDPQDVGAIAEAITYGLRDRQFRADLIARGLDRSQEFTWERCARQVLGVLEQVAVE
jgi:glycosyltransferase involved in cell wall biosynthesis